jgi:2-polyprenyl-3-methyl-5-hydroxy-6-metoxy-1,4-benzoquinol methylase
LLRLVLRRLPIGPRGKAALVSAEALWWNQIRRPARLRRVRIANLFQGIRNSLALTAPNVARQNTRRAYNRLFADDRLVSEYLTDARIRFYDDVVAICVEARADAQSVIDVGCGTGELLGRLSEELRAARLVGIDFAEAAITRARIRVPNAEFVIGDLYDLPEGQRFELVLCTEVLEHVSRPESAVRALVRACSPFGNIVVTVPDGAIDDWDGHVNFWNEDQFRAFLRPFGEITLRRVDGGAALVAIISPRQA